MAFHLTHHEHYILLEPEFDYLDTGDLDDMINQLLGDFAEMSHVIIFAGSLDYLQDEDLDQLMFLNDELVIKGGHLQVVTQSDHLRTLLKGKIAVASSIENAIDTIESEWLDSELFSEES